MTSMPPKNQQTGEDDTDSHKINTNSNPACYSRGFNNLGIPVWYMGASDAFFETQMVIDPGFQQICKTDGSKDEVSGTPV